MEFGSSRGLEVRCSHSDVEARSTGGALKSRRGNMEAWRYYIVRFVGSFTQPGDHSFSLIMERWRSEGSLQALAQGSMELWNSGGSLQVLAQGRHGALVAGCTCVGVIQR